MISSIIKPFTDIFTMHTHIYIDVHIHLMPHVAEIWARQAGVEVFGTAAELLPLLACCMIWPVSNQKRLEIARK